MQAVEATFPRKFEPLLKRRAKFKIIRGGRGGGKSWGVARALLIMGLKRPIRVLCARETQRSLRESVHSLLVDQIAELGFIGFYDIKQVQITGSNGTRFIFTGLSEQTTTSIKSYEGVDICWVEEGHAVTAKSWKILIPTLFRTRKKTPNAPLEETEDAVEIEDDSTPLDPGEQPKKSCELWITFNPELDSDETWRRFVEYPPKDHIPVEINWRDNPWFPDDLNEIRLDDKAKLPPWEYDWIWEGKCKPAITGAIYADQMAELFAQGHVMDLPHNAALPVYAVFDLGYNDSTAIVICQRILSKLHVIDYIENDHKREDYYSAELLRRPYKVQELFLPHDGAHHHLTGPSAERAFQDLGWQVKVLPNQDVEDGIRTLRTQFASLYIDRSCKRLIECLKRYCRIIPKTTGEPSTPKHDQYSHGADAMRYAALAMADMGNRAEDGSLSLPPLKWNWGFK